MLCIFTRPSSLFTDKEWEVILLLLCGVKRNVMADILGVSPLTLRNRLSLCCDKAGVANALIQHCYRNGWDNYNIPPFFCKKAMSELAKLEAAVTSFCTLAHRVSVIASCSLFLAQL